MQYQRELEVALQAIRSAQKTLIELYEQFVPVANAPSNITTIADLQSQEILLKELSKAFPQDSYRAEEATPTLATLINPGPRMWIIDPIDGTRGFARKNGEFSIMVGMVDHGKMAVGAVLEPITNRLTYAVHEGGCWIDDGNDSPRRCQVNGLHSLGEATLTQSHSRNPSIPNAYVGAVKPKKVIETYSAGIKLAQVARGEADIYLNDYDAMHDWDLCAGHILVQEAGGLVTSLYGQPLHYGREDHWHRQGVLACNRFLHPQVEEALKHLLNK